MNPWLALLLRLECILAEGPTSENFVYAMVLVLWWIVFLITGIIVMFCGSGNRIYDAQVYLLCILMTVLGPLVSLAMIKYILFV